MGHLAFDAEAFSTCVNHEDNSSEVKEQLMVVTDLETVANEIRIPLASLSY